MIINQRYIELHKHLNTFRYFVGDHLHQQKIGLFGEKNQYFHVLFYNKAISGITFFF